VNERGAVAITVAFSLLVLMGFAAIALDLSVGYESRRRVQNAADSAALAAAWEACNPVGGTADPVGTGLAMAALNGFDDSAAETSVAVSEDVTGEFTVAIISIENTAFASIAGAGDEMTVGASATARCEALPFLGGYALFAGGPSSCQGGVELDLSGASKIINGGLHSNGDIKVTGAETTINGDVTYIGSSDYSPSTQLTNPPPDPLDLYMSEFMPGGDRAAAAAALGEYINGIGNDIDNNYLTANGYATGSSGNITITQSGIYYTDGDINLNNASVGTGVNVTFVARGQISVAGSGNFSAYEPIVGTGTDPGVLMFSSYLEPTDGGPTCTGNAIQWSISEGTWTGVIYAPNGQAKQSSASSASLNGSIVAYTVNLSGSDFQISWQDNPDAIPDYEVTLLR